MNHLMCALSTGANISMEAQVAQRTTEVFPLRPPEGMNQPNVSRPVSMSKERAPWNNAPTSPPTAEHRWFQAAGRPHAGLQENKEAMPTVNEREVKARVDEILDRRPYAARWPFGGVASHT
jgi:hypothetical protein